MHFQWHNTGLELWPCWETTGSTHIILSCCCHMCMDFKSPMSCIVKMCVYTYIYMFNFQRVAQYWIRLGCDITKGTHSHPQLAWTLLDLVFDENMCILFSFFYNYDKLTPLESWMNKIANIANVHVLFAFITFLLACSLIGEAVCTLGRQNVSISWGSAILISPFPNFFFVCVFVCARVCVICLAVILSNHNQIGLLEHRFCPSALLLMFFLCLSVLFPASPLFLSLSPLYTTTYCTQVSICLKSRFHPTKNSVLLIYNSVPHVLLFR